MLAYKHLFDSNFGKYTDISQEAYQFLFEVFHVKQFKAREYLVEAGNTERYLYFVDSGVQALYIVDQKGEKVVLGFSFDESISGAYDSFIHRQPSATFIETLTPSRLIAISRDNYDLLFERFPEFKNWRMHFFEEILIGRLKREVEFLTLPAKDRYLAFMERCPDPLLQIPQKYLASYLNMKPETFSRLRAQRFS